MNARSEVRHPNHCTTKRLCNCCELCTEVDGADTVADDSGTQYSVQDAGLAAAAAAATGGDAHQKLPSGKLMVLLHKHQHFVFFSYVWLYFHSV